MKNSAAAADSREASRSCYWIRARATPDVRHLSSVLGRPNGHCVMRTIKPIERLVPVSSTHYCAYTPGLSTWWSTTALKGELVSRWVSRLDAFSGYPVRT